MVDSVESSEGEKVSGIECKGHCENDQGNPQMKRATLVEVVALGQEGLWIVVMMVLRAQGPSSLGAPSARSQAAFLAIHSSTCV